MCDDTAVSFLTRSFSGLKAIQPAVSLRMWYDDRGQLCYFLTNLPPKNKRHRIEETTHQNDRSIASQKEMDSTPIVEGNVPVQTPVPQREESPQPRRRGKRRKRPSTSSPEQIRCCETIVSPDISVLNEDREHTIPSVPCYNSFEALLNLEEDNSILQKKDVESPEPTPSLKCSSCQEILQPVTSSDVFDKLRTIMCVLGTNCASGNTDTAGWHNLMKCICPPSERIVCIDCATRPDGKPFFSPVET